MTPGSTSSVFAPLPTLDVSPHTAHAPLPPPPRVPTKPRGGDCARIPASPHPLAPPLPAHPHGTGLREIPQARHRHQSPRPRHTHPRPLLRPRPRPRPGTVVAALDPHAALGAAKVGPGRALPRGAGPGGPRKGSVENCCLQPAGRWMPQAAWEAMLADALHPLGVHPRNLCPRTTGMFSGGLRFGAFGRSGARWHVRWRPSASSSLGVFWAGPGVAPRGSGLLGNGVRWRRRWLRGQARPAVWRAGLLGCCGCRRCRCADACGVLRGCVCAGLGLG